MRCIDVILGSINTCRNCHLNQQLAIFGEVILVSSDPVDTIQGIFQSDFCVIGISSKESYALRQVILNCAYQFIFN